MDIERPGVPREEELGASEIAPVLAAVPEAGSETAGDEDSLETHATNPSSDLSPEALAAIERAVRRDQTILESRALYRPKFQRLAGTSAITATLAAQHTAVVAMQQRRPIDSYRDLH